MDKTVRENLLYNLSVTKILISNVVDSNNRSSLKMEKSEFLEKTAANASIGAMTQDATTKQE